MESKILHEVRMEHNEMTKSTSGSELNWRPEQNDMVGLTFVRASFSLQNANTVSLIKVLIAISSHLLVKIRESFLGYGP
jgi:hypothetical protein